MISFVTLVATVCLHANENFNLVLKRELSGTEAVVLKKGSSYFFEERPSVEFIRKQTSLDKKWKPRALALGLALINPSSPEQIVLNGKDSCSVWNSQPGSEGLRFSKTKLHLGQASYLVPASTDRYTFVIRQREFENRKNIMDERPAEVMAYRQGGKGMVYGYYNLGETFKPCAIKVDDFDGDSNPEALVYWLSLGASGFTTGVSILDIQGVLNEKSPKNPLGFM